MIKIFVEIISSDCLRILIIFNREYKEVLLVQFIKMHKLDDHEGRTVAGTWVCEEIPDIAT